MRLRKVAIVLRVRQAMAIVSVDSAKRHRRARARPIKFDEAALEDDLTPLARLRKTSWRWNGSHYAKPLRSTGPDKHMLAASAPVLRVLAIHAKMATRTLLR